jgi:hypothetical protein
VGFEIDSSGRYWFGRCWLGPHPTSKSRRASLVERPRESLTWRSPGDAASATNIASPYVSSFAVAPHACDVGVFVAPATQSCQSTTARVGFDSGRCRGHDDVRVLRSRGAARRRDRCSRAGRKSAGSHRQGSPRSRTGFAGECCEPIDAYRRVFTDSSDSFGGSRLMSRFSGEISDQQHNEHPSELRSQLLGDLRNQLCSDLRSQQQHGSSSVFGKVAP